MVIRPAVNLSLAPDRFFMSRDYALDYLAHSISSSEEYILPHAILDTVLKKNQSPRSILDIGSADGRLTQRIAQSAEHLTIFEPNPILFSLAVSRLSFAAKTTLLSHNLSFPGHSQLSIPRADLIIASHVLYHVTRPEWPRFFVKISSRLRSSGIFVATLWNKNSDAQKLAAAVAPGHWVSTAEDLDGARDILHEAKLTLFAKTDVNPLIKTYSEEAATRVRRFLVGRRSKDGDGHQLAVFNEIENTVLEIGLNNSQTIFFLKKLDQ